MKRIKKKKRKKLTPIVSQVICYALMLASWEEVDMLSFNFRGSVDIASRLQELVDLPPHYTQMHDTFVHAWVCTWVTSMSRGTCIRPAFSRQVRIRSYVEDPAPASSNLYIRALLAQNVFFLCARVPAQVVVSRSRA